jgi:hypothetical protein
MCHESEDEAVKRGLEGFQFFGYALAHYYLFGTHTPGQTNIFDSFRQNAGLIPGPPTRGGIGTPDQVREHLKSFASTGVDQVVFIQQGGNNRHEDICSSLELFAARVMPEFKEAESARQRRKAEELAPYVEQAMARKKRVQDAGDLAAIPAYGRNIVEGGGGVYPTRTQ